MSDYGLKSVSISKRNDKVILDSKIILANPTTTIIVLNWNQRDLLIECLRSLQRQTQPAEYITVVDNGSTDGSAEKVRVLFPEVNVISLFENTGFAVANNIAIRTCRSKYVALLNNDTVADPHWLKCLVDAMEIHPEAGMAASKMVYDDDPTIIDRVGDGYSIAGAGILRGRGEPALSFTKQEKIFGACAGAAIYCKEMLEEIGLFDEEYFLINEDVDLNFRAQLAGYQCLYVPKAVVRHKASQTIGRDSDTSVYYGHRNLEWVYLKNMPMPLIVATLIPHLIYIFLSGAYFFSMGKGRIYLKAKFDALKTFNKMLVKRRFIQINRKVSLLYLWKLFTFENPIKRLTARR